MTTNSVNFTSRCPEIRQAQWVCHSINANFPHLSTTRIAPFIDKLEDKFPEVHDKFVSTNRLVGKLPQITNNKEKKIFQIFSWIKRLTRTLNLRREERCPLIGDYAKMSDVLSQFKYTKLANCGENAKLSALIMKLNGHKNVYTASIKVGNKHIDHVVCFFNKDGSKFDGTIKNNKTIMIDSWLNEADFANNMLIRYRNIYKDFMFIPKDGKLSFRDIKSLDLTQEELAQLASEFPQLVK